MMESSPLNYRRVIIWIGRIVLGGIFMYAGYAKVFLPNFIASPWFALKFSLLSNLSNFAYQVESYKLLSPSASDVVAHTLPFAEMLLGLLLLIGWQLRVWATLISLLLLGFLTVVTRAYLLHMQINCGCFAKPEPLTGWTVVRDGALLGFALLVTVFAFVEAKKPHPWSAATSA
jgi:uncharacterized membrane protein YphA (DoxX/SURF4 family)